MNSFMTVTGSMVLLRSGTPGFPDRNRLDRTLFYTLYGCTNGDLIVLNTILLGLLDAMSLEDHIPHG
jgi:hypothetical protein